MRLSAQTYIVAVLKCAISLVRTLLSVTNEESVLEEAMDNPREAVQRIRATQNVMHARGMTEEVNYRELLTRLSTALAMTEAAYVGDKEEAGAACEQFDCPPIFLFSPDLTTSEPGPYVDASAA